MDVYDQAAGLSTPKLIDYGNHDTRLLMPDEFEALVEHLLDTEMPPLRAVAALKISLNRLTLDDIERLATRITRCRECNTWTRNDRLLGALCPDCQSEKEGV